MSNLYRLTSVTFPGSRTVSYGYDDASRRTSITYPGGSNQATYGFDNANRLILPPRDHRLVLPGKDELHHLRVR